MIEAVIFDLDDTLIDERDWMLSGYYAVATELLQDGLSDGVASLVAMMLAAYRCDPRRVFDQLSTNLRIPVKHRPDWVKRCVHTYRHHVPVLPSAAGGRTAIQSCRLRFRVVIATGGYAAGQRAKVAAAGFEPMVDGVLFEDDLPPEFRKPDPRWFLRAAEIAGVVPGSCVHVADNPLKDFAAAHAIGMRTVRVRRPNGLYGELESVAVDAEVGTVEEVIAVLDQWHAPESTRS